MSSTNPTTKSRERWRKEGYWVETAESTLSLPGGFTRKSDLFGFVDLVLLPPKAGESLVWVQVTSRSNMSARLRKIQREETGKGQWSAPIRDLARKLLERGDRILIEGWDRDKKNGRWRVKDRYLTLEDLEDGA